MTALIDDLMAIHEAGEPAVDGGACIRRLDGAWLSGTPYLWTHFAERAFVFRDRQQALEIQAKYNLTGEIVTGF